MRRLQGEKVTTLIIIAVIVFVAILAFVMSQIKPVSENNEGAGFSFGRDSDSGEEIFIIANPIDLDEISSISQFRSCAGHDFSGKNIDGVKETNRSMKHYITTNSNISLAKAFAPFNGEMHVETDQSGRGSLVQIVPEVNSSYLFIFFHTDLLPQYQNGGSVKAGELLGHGLVNTQAKNFDYALKKFERFGGPNIFDTPFNHMTDQILAEYAAVGVTPENVVISKEMRDDNPCDFGQGSGNDEQVFLK